MKKTFFLIVIVMILIAIFYSIRQKVSSSTASPFVTVCIDNTCTAVPYSAQLFTKDGATTVLWNCTIGINGTCCSLDAALVNIQAGYYFWVITGANGSNCTGSTFYFNGRQDKIYTFSCPCSTTKK